MIQCLNKPQTLSLVSAVTGHEGATKFTDEHLSSESKIPRLKVVSQRSKVACPAFGPTDSDSASETENMVCFLS